MEVAINTCYGGFDLSYDAVMAYAERKGFKLYAYVSARDGDGSISLDKYVPYTVGEKCLCIHYTKSPVGEYSPA